MKTLILDLDETLVHSSFRPHDNHAAGRSLRLAATHPVAVAERINAPERFCQASHMLQLVPLDVSSQHLLVLPVGSSGF